MKLRLSPRLTALLLLLTLIALLLPAALSVPVATDASYAIVPKDSEGIRLHQRYLARYPRDFGAAIALWGLACSDSGWKLLETVEEKLDRLPVVDRVTALPTSDYVRDMDGVVAVDDFGKVEFATAEQRCRAAAEYEPYKELLINSGRTAVAIYITAAREVNEIEFSDAVNETLDSVRPEVESLGGRIAVTGEAITSAELTRLTEKSSRLIAAVGATMFVVVWLMTGNAMVGALALISGFFAIIGTFGVMGYLQLTRTPVNSIVVNLLIPIAAAFTIHAYSYVKSAEMLILRMFPKRAIKPFFFAALTTAIGFGATALSKSPDVRTMGLLGIVGIFFCLLSMFLLVFPVLAGSRKSGEKRVTGVGVADVTENAKAIHPTDVTNVTKTLSENSLPPLRPILAISFFVLLVLFSGIGLSKLQIDYVPASYFEENNPVRSAYDDVGKEFGHYTIPLVIETGEIDSATEPDAWKPLVELVEQERAQSQSMRISWFYDQMSAITKAFTADSESPLNFPETREQFAQFLILFDSFDLEPFLDADRRSFVILFQVPFDGSTEFLEFKSRVKEFLVSHKIEGEIVGRVNNFFSIGQQIGLDNITSIIAGLTAILLALWLLLRSFRMAIIGTLVNGLPILACLGALGLLGIPLDLGSSIVAAVALGIAVDDSSHFLMRYQSLKRKGISCSECARRALEELRNPILTTTLAVVAGFSWMNLAEMTPFLSFSRVLSVALIIALLADLYLLPYLLAKFDRPLRRFRTPAEPLET